jgi:hypothetical protein
MGRDRYARAMGDQQVALATDSDTAEALIAVTPTTLAGASWHMAAPRRWAASPERSVGRDAGRIADALPSAAEKNVG